MDDLKTLMKEMGLLGPFDGSDIVSRIKDCKDCETSCVTDCSQGCLPSNQPGSGWV